MDKKLAETLFLVMFSISLSTAITNVFKSIYPYGVGHVVKDGMSGFLIRATFIAVVVSLSSFGLVLALKFCNRVESKGIIADFINVLTILIFAIIPWFCDHLTRVLFLPFNKLITIREAEFKGVDLIFIIIYCVLIAMLLFVHYFWTAIFVKR